jgi:MoaA/NifB/PqqE/SkfB family radical SAM enzyme
MIKLAYRMMTEPSKRALWKFAFNFGWKGMRAVGKFQKRLKQGINFPAFFFISITNRCNLHCQGCWVSTEGPAHELDLDTCRNIINSCKEQGSYFFGILGGEPLMHKGLFDLMAEHPECYFLLFTNGTLITDEIAARMQELGNVSPLISVEGLEEVSDVRRGGTDVYARTMEGIDHCRKHRLVIGVATSACKSNLKDLASEKFLKDMIARGVHYLWYYVYRPVGPDPKPELKLSPDEVVELRQFMVDMRSKYPLMIVDAYWDHLGRALCPAATGIGHHISPEGFIEPCPPIQLAGENVGDGTNLYETVTKSEFLKGFRELATGCTRGCIIMEHPDKLNALQQEMNATDSSGRGTMTEEMAAMLPCCSHNVPGKEIPEKSWGYRFAKKFWFFGFGAYG